MSANYNTKHYYIENATKYISKTINVDMSEHYTEFLSRLSPGSKILDVGFGSGRDMLYFQEQGHVVVGIDNVPDFVKNASSLGLNAKLIDFHDITYANEFDGIWACASLLHSEKLQLAFKKLATALKPNGTMYISMKYGNGSKIVDGKYCTYVNETNLNQLCSVAHLSILEIYKSNDALQRASTWINALLTK